MSNLIPEGVYLAKAGEFEFGRSSKGNEQIGVAFTITQGEHAGCRLTWFGFFNSADNEDRTIRSLRAAGWAGDDITSLDGLGSVEASIVVEVDDYNGDRRNKVAWVNAPGVAMKEKLNDAEKKALAARLKGKVLASKPKGASSAAPYGRSGAGANAKHTGTPERSESYGDDDIPFVVDMTSTGAWWLT